MAGRFFAETANGGRFAGPVRFLLMLLQGNRPPGARIRSFPPGTRVLVRRPLKAGAFRGPVEFFYPTKESEHA